MSRTVEAVAAESADGAAHQTDPDLPPIVAEEESLLRVVLRKLDEGPKKSRLQVDDAALHAAVFNAIVQNRRAVTGVNTKSIEGQHNAPPVTA